MIYFDNFPEAYESICNYLQKCYKERHYDRKKHLEFYQIINAKRHKLIRKNIKIRRNYDTKPTNIKLPKNWKTNKPIESA